MREIHITAPEGFEIDPKLTKVVFKPMKGLNVVNLDISDEMENCPKGKINGGWAFSIFKAEDEGKTYKGCQASGHKASLFLANCEGTWYDEEGNTIDGYLYYKSKK